MQELRIATEDAFIEIERAIDNDERLKGDGNVLILSMTVHGLTDDEYDATCMFIYLSANDAVIDVEGTPVFMDRRSEEAQRLIKKLASYMDAKRRGLAMISNAMASCMFMDKGAMPV